MIDMRVKCKCGALVCGKDFDDLYPQERIHLQLCSKCYKELWMGTKKFAITDLLLDVKYEGTIPQKVNGGNTNELVTSFCTSTQLLHDLLKFTSHYMCFGHLMWTFLVDMSKGIIPNTQIKEEEKLEYALEAFEILDADGSFYLDTMIDSVEIDKNYSIDIKSDGGGNKNKPEYYYSKLPNNWITSKKIIGGILLIHVFLLTLMEDLKELQEDKDKWQLISDYILWMEEKNIVKRAYNGV